MEDCYKLCNGYYEFVHEEMKPPYHKGKRHKRQSGKQRHEETIRKQKTEYGVKGSGQFTKGTDEGSMCPHSGTSSSSKTASPFERNDDFTNHLGSYKGIQGRDNSCYLDVVLFSLFYTTNAFDAPLLLERASDNAFSKTVRYILREKIVLPLRTHPFYCKAENVSALRNKLSERNAKAKSSFMAIEDIVFLLFDQALNEQSFIEYTEGISGYMHVLLADSTATDMYITIQKNLEFSMVANGDLKFSRVPFPVLIVSLPWHKEKLFHYESVAPVLELEIETMCSQECCRFCEKNATWESLSTITCKTNTDRVDSTCYLCNECLNHLDGISFVNREKMRLLAIVIYHNSHFTVIVRSSANKHCLDKPWEETRWIYFNSLTENGPNVGDVTDKLKYMGKSKESKDMYETWNMAFKRVSNVHTCFYEPIIYKNGEQNF